MKRVWCYVKINDKWEFYVLSQMQSDTQKKITEIQELQVKMKELAMEGREKDDLYKQLVSRLFQTFLRSTK